MGVTLLTQVYLRARVHCIMSTYAPRVLTTMSTPVPVCTLCNVYLRARTLCNLYLYQSSAGDRVRTLHCVRCRCSASSAASLLQSQWSHLVVMEGVKGGGGVFRGRGSVKGGRGGCLGGGGEFRGRGRGSVKGGGRVLKGRCVLSGEGGC